MENIIETIKWMLWSSLQPGQKIKVSYDGDYFSFFVPNTALIFLSDLQDIIDFYKKIEADTGIKWWMWNIEYDNWSIIYSTSFSYETEDGEEIDSIYKVEKKLNKYWYTIWL